MSQKRRFSERWQKIFFVSKLTVYRSTLFESGVLTKTWMYRTTFKVNNFNYFYFKIKCITWWLNITFLPITKEVVLGDKWNWLWMILGIKAEEPLNTMPSQHPAKQSRTRLVFLNSSVIAAGSSLSLLKASDLPLLMTASDIFDSWAVSQPEILKLIMSTFLFNYLA